MNATNQLQWYHWALVAALLLTQATWIFLDARKRRVWPWFWGLVGLISCPGSLILYWLVVIRRAK